MSITLTVDVFSGRPNPTVVIEGPQERELLERLQPEEKVSATEAEPFSEVALGYRGIVVQIEGERPRDLPSSFRIVNGLGLSRKPPFRIADSGFEEFVCGSTGPLRPIFRTQPKLPPVLFEERRRWLERWDAWRPPLEIKWPLRPICRCGPLYEPDWWNVPAIQPHNNCYNYGTNVRTNTFAQPGRAAGSMYSSLTCAAVRSAAVSDKLIDAPDADNKCPDEGHLVALVIWPGVDFHWYRKGRNGRWSHKPGGTAVTNLDNSAAAILDPRKADRGPYTDFCTFMIVMHGHVCIE